MIHQDPKVVSQIGSSHAQRPHTRKHQQLSEPEDRSAKNGLVQLGRQGLRVESRLEEMVTEDTEREDGEGEGVTAIVGGAEDASEDVLVVFKACDSVPEERVE